ncbi:MAG TPA: hypothetical protein VFZ11_02495 [Gemmatimonadaceae bacterium]
MSETRTRFLREIAARIPVERLVELHLFPAMRQGAIESGVAVVAATPEVEPPVAGPAPAGDPGTRAADTREDDDAARQMAMDEILAAGDAPACDADDAPPADERAPIVRHTVYTAHYRATLKGPDRGKWEFFLVAEADAPLVTIDAVVRGVQRRSTDAADPERLTPEALQAMDGEAWATSTA